MLSYESTSHHDFILPRFLSGKAVELVILAIEVLAWVPVEVDIGGVFIANKFKPDNGKGLEKGNGTFREL